MFSSIKKGLSKTLEAIRDIVPVKQEKVSKELLEETLLEADVPYELVEEIIYYLPPQNSVGKEDVKRVLKSYFIYDEKIAVQAAPF
ncbi:MAG: signal recognition particle-docking protein FtsY, partial [Campylobacteraceae bacterium]|nr:signal recognition particle-docking protein FtsY [Campylobacteraceae bacterium]